MEVSDLVQCIEKQLGPAECYIRDLTGEGNHFEAHVVSLTFQDKSRIERHRLVMDAVKDLLNGPLHALTIKTWTPKEWENAQ
jgi:stress-induced morphogen